jgi:hypothetical protein
MGSIPIGTLRTFKLLVRDGKEVIGTSTSLDMVSLSNQLAARRRFKEFRQYLHVSSGCDAA